MSRNSNDWENKIIYKKVNYMNFWEKNRSSQQRCSIEKGVLTNFIKQLCQGLFFNKVAGLRTATLLKKRLCRRSFPMTFAKFLRTPILQTRIHRTSVLKIAGRILNCAWDCQLKYLRYFITV